MPELQRRARRRARASAVRVSLLAALWLALPQAAAAARFDVELPAIFGDHMVLQRELAVPVWGRADPGEEVAVSIGGASATAVAGEDGRWSVELAGLRAGGPHRLVVRGANELALEDVLIGEVWLGSGQSNMAMTVEHCSGYAEAAESAGLPAIRFFREQSLPSTAPQWRGEGRWIVCSPDTFGEFSGTLFYFGRELHARLGVPVGLVDSSIGGSPIESWIRRDSQHAVPELRASVEAQEADFEAFDVEGYLEGFRERRRAWQAAVAQAAEDGREPPPREWNLAELHLRIGGVGHLFNSKIVPLVPYGIRGVLWYQGEANYLDAPLYRHQLPLLVRDWRELWGREDLPFAWVQLPNFAPGFSWPILREVQRRSLAISRTGMAIAIDLGEADDIHPRNKRDVGERLALWARGAIYGHDVPTSGPLYESHELRGHEVIVRFRHTGDGLVVKGEELAGFELAGPRMAWIPAAARLEEGAVIVAAPPIANPTALRYGWAADPRCNLYNAAGLPAAPFTTVDEYWAPESSLSEDE